MTRYCRHRILTGTVIQGEQRHVFLTTYQQKASPVRSLQFLELFVKKKNKEYQKVSLLNNIRGQCKIMLTARKLEFIIRGNLGR